LRCSIPTVNTRADHTSYTLSLEAVGGPQAAWTVEKVRAWMTMCGLPLGLNLELTVVVDTQRYSEFFHLQQTLQAAMEAMAGAGGPPLPSLPPKQWLGKMDPMVVEARRIDLETFMRALLRSPFHVGLTEDDGTGEAVP